MKTESFEGTISSAYGNPINPALTFSGTYDHLENLSEVPAGERLTPDEELTVINNKRKASKRQSAMQSALDAAGIKKPTLEDSAVQIREMAKILLAAKKVATQDEAESKAKELLGL
jgi:hypothetical protein